MKRLQVGYEGSTVIPKSREVVKQALGVKTDMHVFADFRED